MGYHTEFKGELKFTKELLSSELGYLNSILGEDCRSHPEWKNEIEDLGMDSQSFTYMDLILLDDFSGVQWNYHTEKTYDLTEKVQLLINLMNKKFNNDFGLVGKLYAQGEVFDDRWVLICDDKKVTEEKVVITGQKIRCPHCDEYFILEKE
jgi:hypothetical protein